MEILPRSKYAHSLKEWEYRIILEHHKELSAQQIATVIKRHVITVTRAGKRLKIKFKSQLFVTGKEVLPDAEEYKQLYSK